MKKPAICSKKFIFLVCFWQFFTAFPLFYAQERITQGCSFVKRDWAKSDGRNLLLGIKRGKSVKNCQKLITNMIFWSKSVFFESNLLSKLPMLLFFKEQQERLAHGCSIVKSNKSDSSQLLFFKEWKERFAHAGSFLLYRETREQIAHCRSLKWAILSESAKSKEQIPNLYIFSVALLIQI